VRFRVIAAMIWICGILSLCALKTEASDYTGSIEIRMLKNGNVVSGGSVTVYRVAYWDGEMYRKTLAFEQFMDGEKEWLDAGMGKRLCEYASGNGIEGITQRVNESGKAIFLNLEKGIYLVVQKDPADGFLPFCPFVVALPSYNEGIEINSIIAYPKCMENTQGQSPQTGDTDLPIELFILSGIGTVWIMWNLLKQNKKVKM